MNLDDMSSAYRVLNYGIADWADDADRKKGIHDVRRFGVYPAFPWKMDGTDHREDNALFFIRECVKSGRSLIIRAEDIDKHHTEPTITYTQWLEMHKNDPGFVNYLEGDMK